MQHMQAPAESCKPAEWHGSACTTPCPHTAAGHECLQKRRTRWCDSWCSRVGGGTEQQSIVAAVPMAMAHIVQPTQNRRLISGRSQLYTAAQHAQCLAWERWLLDGIAFASGQCDQHNAPVLRRGRERKCMELKSTQSGMMHAPLHAMYRCC